MRKLRWIMDWRLCTLLLAALAGCGGSSSEAVPTTVGGAEFRLEWPTRSRVLPTLSESVKIEILNGNAPITQQTTDRPAAGGTSLVTFTNLPTGSLIARMTAYPQPGGNGTPQGIGSTSFIVTEGGTTEVSVDVDSTVTSFSVADVAVAVGQSIDVAPQVFNAQGDVVIVPPPDWTIVSGDAFVSLAAAARLEAATLRITGVAPGVATIRADVAQSADAGGNLSATFQVTVQAVNQTRTLTGTVTDATTGQGIVGATVSSGSLQATTGAGGAWSLPNVPTVGTIQLAISATDYQPRTVEVTNTSQTVVNVTLQPVQAPLNQGPGTAAGGITPVDDGDPSAAEQEMLELINRARRNPGAEATRLGIDLNEGLAPGTISNTPQPPLAMNPNLLAAAREHCVDMATNNYFAHTNLAGESPFDRMQRHGYAFQTAGENLSVRSTSTPNNTEQNIIPHHDQLFIDAGVAGRGHRINILHPPFRDLGAAFANGPFTSGGTTLNGNYHTDNFGAQFSPNNRFVMGVVYNDANNDGICTHGEGLANVVVTLNGATWVTRSIGAFTFLVPAGTFPITFQGTNVAGNGTVTVGTNSVKVDFVQGTGVVIH